jgi:hypothetical protein
MIKCNSIQTLIIVMIISIMLNSYSSAQGLPFFGQDMPGMQPVRFAPNIFTQELHAPPIFSPDGTEVYWNIMEPDYPHILYMKLENGIWSDPGVAPFCIGDFTDSPFISSDGTKLLFLTMNQPEYEENICLVERQNGEWGTPVILGDEVNQFVPHWQASIANNQNLYFGAQDDIYFSEYVDGSYTTAQNLGPAINTEDGHETTPFIAPDESYLIFGRVQGSSPYSNLFISSKNVYGSWSEAVNLSELNSIYHELYPNVSPDGRFMMFLSVRSGLSLPYWVDAQIIYNYIMDVDDENNTGIPISYQLHQNYPNPFNPTTTIKYDIPVSTNVVLTIYNIMGKEVKTLVNEYQSAGILSIIWNGTDNSGNAVSSGVYIYSIQIDMNSQSKKMVLMK